MLVQAGLDSLGAVDLRNSLAAGLGVEVPATVAFDYPNVNALSRYAAAITPPHNTKHAVSFADSSTHAVRAIAPCSS